MRTYRRITNGDRLQIKTFLDMNLCASEIAIKMNFHRSSIGREITRNSGGRGYRHKQACTLSLERQGYRSIQRKKTDLTKVSKKEIEKIEFEINNRPMKCLDWKSPYEVMFKKSCTAFV